MKNKYLYDHGLPFSEILGDNLKDCIKRVDDGKASMIIVDGGVGEGKTTFVVEILDTINMYKGRGPIDIDGPQLALGGVDFLRKLRVCHDEKLPCIAYDEAGDFSKRGSLTNFNAMINRTFETFRAFKCIVILVLPNFDVLDNQLFDNKIPRMLLHLKDRSSTYGNFQAYGLPEMMWLKYWMGKSPIKNFAFSRVYPNFYGHFLDITPERSKELDKVSTKNKLNILRKSEVKIEGLMTYPELATKLQKSIDWIRRAANNLKLKPKRTIGRQAYFDQTALNILAGHVDATQTRDKPRRK